MRKIKKMKAYFQIALMAMALILAACRKSELPDLKQPFVPAAMKSLKELDAAGCAYGDSAVELEAIVSPLSQGGFTNDTLGCDVHGFTLAAWSISGQGVIERDLYVMRAVAPNSEYFSDYPSFTIHRMRVLLSKDSTRAVIEKVLTLDKPNNRLLELGRELRDTIVVNSDLFGKLVLNREMDLFEGKAIWAGMTVALDLPTDDRKSINHSALQIAAALWGDQAKWEREMERLIIKELLPLKNSEWLNEGEAELSQATFLKRIRLGSVSIGAVGNFEFWYKDNGLFGGHVIEVRGNIDKGVESADISG
jgi:hypothetical protein